MRPPVRPPPLPTARKRSDPLIGSLAAGRYRIRSLIGEGGMGRVYLAVHEAIQKKVALKILRHEFSTKPEIVSRFQQEAISASRIKHPNVLDVFDFGQLADGCFFLAMEHLEGIDLADELKAQHKIEPRRAVRLALQICRALGTAHARGVIHRDMKPENVFLQRTDDGDEVVKILDFGIAQLRSAEDVAAREQKRRLTRTGMIFGTPEYMAPEQATGKPADLRVDIYAVGIILYEMFTGAVPFTGDTFMGVLTAHVNEPLPAMRALYPDLVISPQLEQVIEHALAKNPEERFQSMNDFAAALLLTPEAAKASYRPPAPSPHVSSSGWASAEPLKREGPASSRAPASLAGGAGPESGARAQTQLGAEAGPPPSFRPQRRWPYFVAGLLLAGGGAVAGAMLMPSFGSAPSPAATAPRLAPTPSSQPSANTAPPPSAEAPPATPAPTGVKLSVSTEPSGALLLKNGFQVCDETPCEVVAQNDETVLLEARKGALRGTAKVLAQQDQNVTITLQQAARSRRASVKSELCEVEVDGLKILRPCQ